MLSTSAFCPNESFPSIYYTGGEPRTAGCGRCITNFPPVSDDSFNPRYVSSSSRYGCSLRGKTVNTCFFHHSPSTASEVMAKINSSIGPLITDSQSSISNSKKSHHKHYAIIWLCTFTGVLWVLSPSPSDEEGCWTSCSDGTTQGVWIRWTGTVDWNGLEWTGMVYYNIYAECKRAQRAEEARPATLACRAHIVRMSTTTSQLSPLIRLSDMLSGDVFLLP